MEHKRGKSNWNPDKRKKLQNESLDGSKLHGLLFLSLLVLLSTVHGQEINEMAQGKFLFPDFKNI